MVPHPRQRQGLPRSYSRPANTDLHERANRQGRCPGVETGSICIYRDDFDVDLSQLRNDVQFFAVPFEKLVEKAYPPDKTDKGYRDKLRKVINMVYVGVLAAVCRIEFEAVESGIRREFPGRKAKAGEININAARTGFEWATDNLPTDLPFRSSAWSRPMTRS